MTQFNQQQITRVGGRQIAKNLLRSVYSVKSSFGYSPEAFGSETYDLELAYQMKHIIGEVNPFAASTKLHDQAGHGQQV